ncbi:LicD family protein [Candidatus Saccharibacteria bacterium]|nr:LicD family protein [Candidatus Saccharibacteria bacterium]
MKRLSLIEHQKVMLDILLFFDKKCRENGIQYTLIGGSLIGAIRHKGFIPWDDDIDVGLTRKNYDKIIKILEKEHKTYQLLKDGNGGERFAFHKLIDTRTSIIEPQLSKQCEGYGVYLDIFCFDNAPNDEKIRKKYIKRKKILVSLFSRKKLSRTESIKQNIMRTIKNIVSVIIGYRNLNNISAKLCAKYNNEKTEYVVSNWPLYAVEQETHKTKNFQVYVDAIFCNKTVMISADYDEILRNTFGDYMQLPPKEQRINKHGLIAFWK